MFKTLNLRKLLTALLITFASGFLAYIFSKNAIQDYANLNLPPLSPPPIVFGIVWPILYFLMSIALYIVSVTKSAQPKKSLSYILYGVQLIFNITWTLLFFVFEFYTFSAIWLGILILVAAACNFVFFKINKTAGILFLPYLVWLLFALYLNIGTAVLN